jgi:hypothetical protein
VPTEPRVDELLEEVRRAKEAYLLVLRKAFLDGLDPYVLVQRGVVNRGFQHHVDRQNRAVDASDQTIDLRDGPREGRHRRAGDLRREQPLSHYLG